MFRDSSYYDLWCVRAVNDRRFESPHSQHFSSKFEADAYLQWLLENNNNHPIAKDEHAKN